MRTDNHHSRVAVWTPWGAQPSRTDQAAQAEGDASNCAFVIPFLPFPIRPSAGSFASAAGLVAVPDTHRDSEKEMSCVTRVLTGAAKCM
ncbi:hypothetical protein [Synechococcus phage Yong-M2-251]|nr:hypothetical protein [Synechococcus phage Yong-M2-251]